MNISLSNPNWQDDKSTKEQRQLIDVELRRRARLDYKQLLELCTFLSHRPIKDIGQLTKGEASRVIDTLKHRLP